MLMVPVAAHRRGGDNADRLIILPQHLVAVTVFPWGHAQRFGPGIGVALALDRDQHRGRMVLVRLGIAAGLVLADESVEAVAAHVRLDPAIARRAAVIERQFGG